MKRLAIRLSQQAGKSLVIPRNGLSRQSAQQMLAKWESIYIKALDLRLRGDDE